MADQQTETAADAPDMDKIIARITKLLTRTKTDRGSSEAEADTAMKMAQELMAKYNLDMAVIEAAAASKEGNGPVERVKEAMKGRAMYKWQRQLAKYVAEANFCYYMTKTTQEWRDAYYKLDKDANPLGDDDKPLAKTVTAAEWNAMPYHIDQRYTRVDGRYQTTHTNIFVGRKNNVITAQLMYQYLTETIEDLVPVTDNTQRLSRSAMSWKEGCADRLCERLAQRREDLINAHDARMKQEAEDRRAEFERRRAEQQAAQKRQLTANHETEVRAAVDGIAADAYDRSGPKPEAEEPDRPEVNESDTWTPAGEEVAEPDAGAALVLASVYDQSEREANYEVANGWEPGTIARYRAQREQRERLAAEQKAKEQIAETDTPVTAETERQRKAREKKERDEELARRRRWAREDAAAERRAAREWSKRDHSAYRAGTRTGESIGLDTQIARNTDSTKKLGGGK